jgi:hypothetical protein
MGVQSDMENLAGAALKQTIDKAAAQAEAKHGQQRPGARAAAREIQGDAPPVNLGASEAVRLMREEREKRGIDPNATDEAARQELGFDLEEIDDQGGDGAVAATADVSGAPEWALVPQSLIMPAGWVVWFLKIPSKDTNAPRKGSLLAPPHDDGQLYRQCILWNLTEADEKRASRRAAGNAHRIIDEMAKAMIRVIDGQIASFQVTAGPTSVGAWWDEIGGKYRHVLKSIYLRTHTLDEKENTNFFLHCVAPRTVG